MKHGLIFSMLSTALCLALAACNPDDPCDPGQYADHGACYPIRKARDAAADDDAGDAASDVERYAGFGQSCQKASECPASAPDCGAPMLPQCTMANCMDKGPDTCPPDWTCLDVTALSPDPKVRSVCVKL